MCGATSNARGGLSPGFHLGRENLLLIRRVFLHLICPVFLHFQSLYPERLKARYSARPGPNRAELETTIHPRDQWNISSRKWNGSLLEVHPPRAVEHLRAIGMIPPQLGSSPAISGTSICHNPPRKGQGRRAEIRCPRMPPALPTPASKSFSGESAPK